MNKHRLASAVLGCLLLVAAHSASAAGFLQKTVNCPANGFGLVTNPDGDISLDSIILSADSATDFTIKYTTPGGGPKHTVIKVNLAGNDVFNLTFPDGIDGEPDALLRASCAGEAVVQVTLTGGTSGF